MYVQSFKKRFRHIDVAFLDLISLNIAFVVAYFVYLGYGNPYSNSVYTNFIIIICLADMLVVNMLGSYSDIEKRGCFKEFVSLLKQSIIIFLLGVFFLYAVKDAQLFSRVTMGMMGCLFLTFDFLLRLLWKKSIRLIRKKSPEKAILIIADKRNMQSAIENFESNADEGYIIKGVVFTDDIRYGNIGKYPIICAIKDVPNYICHNWVDDVMVVMSTIDGISKKTLKEITETGVVLHIGLQEKDSILGSKQFIERFGGYNVITSCMNEASSLSIILKRLMDICGGIVGCIITGFLYLFIAPIIKSKSPGPVFFKQKRVGKNGKVFYVYKFRSMYMDAEARKKELVAANRVSDGLMFKLDFDPRVIGNEILPDGTKKTGIGDFIRRNSLDEFPQFFNVLKGEMSLVGTRPPTLDEWGKYDLHHKARLSIKPGITGMWQVNGRSEITDFEKVVSLDTKYINEWSLGLDIKIILKTIAVVFNKDGAM